jgi:hypothetical protein
MSGSGSFLEVLRIALPARDPVPVHILTASQLSPQHIPFIACRVHSLNHVAWDTARDFGVDSVPGFPTARRGRLRPSLPRSRRIDHRHD